MALVAYDYSSDSEDNITDEEADDTTESRVIMKEQNRPASPSKQITNSEITNSKSDSGLFSHLPQAKSNTTHTPEENDQLEDFIPTVKTLKEKKKVQITIPSLSDFEEPSSEESVPKRAKPSQKGSGLLGILPPVHSTPKSNTMFIPDALKKKNNPSKPAAVGKVSTTHLSKKSDKILSSRPKKGTTSDSDTDNEDIAIPDTFDDQMWEKVCGRSKPPPVTVKLDMTAQPEPEPFSSAPVPEKPYDGLDNVAFKELVGKSKRPIGNIKLIDITEDEIMPDKDLWMTKSLTDPDLAPRPAPQDPVDPTKKRKHHITYLAQQAKANEQELKSAWAAGKNNRMMSRAKYGF